MAILNGNNKAMSNQQDVALQSQHDARGAMMVKGATAGKQGTQFTYTFENFFHPFLGELIQQLNKESLHGMMDATWQGKLKKDFFKDLYDPTEDNTVQVKYFPKEIDVSTDGSYANYNWELFFHIPLTIAVHLSKNQRFAEAQRWFHYIFDPTCNDTSIPIPNRYWKFTAFRNDDSPQSMEQFVKALSDPKVAGKLLGDYKEILNKPFQPHVVARTRPLAYQYSVVMKYLDNLIAWGDHLFQQDTIETINEATQVYVLAANLLGKRPQRIPPRGTIRPKSFAQLKEAGLGPIGDAMVAMEGRIPFNLAASSSGTAASKDAEGKSAVFGIGRTLYFCIPRNEKMLGYWDAVADRLFKIRHCMNIEGVVRQLALFEPPIDPGMLVKATAAGIDIGVIVNGLNQPASPLRAQFLIQKALELCGEVRGLGGALLSALEKGDAEHLALVRQRHEIQIQTMSQDVRFLQWKQTQEATKSLLTSRKTALERFHYYQRLLGLPADPNVPEDITLDQRELTEENFDESYLALIGQYGNALTMQQFPDRLADDSSPDLSSGYSGSGKVYLSKNEGVALNTNLPNARNARLVASAANVLAAAFTPIPDVDGKLHPWGVGTSLSLPGGQKLSAVSKIMGEIAQTYSAWEQDQAGMASQYASYERRADDWLLQYNFAAHELMQIGRQILTSLIAEQIAHHEYLNIQQQIRNANEVDQILHDKFTNEELYLWMQGELSKLYYEYYRFAFDTARKAEQAMKRELMRPELEGQDFVKFNYWDGGRKGLLSGEALHLDVKRMEMAYHENNKREYELTKHISLRQLNPVALLALKATGSCEVTIPEWIFDLDCPGHYMRRIKNVSLSIPSVTGPYASVNCTLSLLRSSLRRSSSLGDDYKRQGAEDERFIDYLGTIQSMVTSNANNDSGMFEVNLREERPLHFEGAGACSTWRLELPKEFRQFDYNTISDVILHMRYTARQGGAVLAGKAVESIRELIGDAKKSGFAQMFSLKHDFPSEWNRFLNGENFTAKIKKEYFSYLVQGKNITINEVMLYTIQNNKLVSATPSEINLQACTSGINNATKKEFEIPLPADKTGLQYLLVKYSV